jgi:hypothetical protein
VLFVALAVLESHRDVIMRYLVEVRNSHVMPELILTEDASQFDEILKVCCHIALVA